MASDLSVFHRIDDPEALAPQHLIDLAVRLAAYGGVVAARAKQEATETRPMGAEMDGMHEVDASTAMLAADPVLSDLIDFG